MNMKSLPLLLLLAAAGCSADPSASTTLLDPGGSSKSGVDASLTPIAVSLVADAASVPVGKALTLTATATATNGAVVYLWDFGDTLTSSTATASTAHAYTRTGQFTASVQARDATQARGTASITVGVTDAPVEPPPPPDVPPPAVLTVTFACARGSDAATCTVVPSLNGVAALDQVSSVDWNWGDGTTSHTSGAVGTHPYPALPVLKVYHVTAHVQLKTGATVDVSTDVVWEPRR